MGIFSKVVFIIFYLCIVFSFFTCIVQKKRYAIHIFYGHILAVLSMVFLYLPASYYHVFFHYISIGAFLWSNYFVILYLLIEIKHAETKKLFIFFLVYSPIDMWISCNNLMQGIIIHKVGIMSAYLFIGIVMIKKNTKKLLGIYITGTLLIIFTLCQYFIAAELLFENYNNILTGQIFYILQAISLTMVFLLSFIEEKFRENADAISLYKVEKEINQDRDFFMNKMRESLVVPLTKLDNLLSDFQEKSDFYNIDTIKKNSYNVAKIINHLIEITKLQLDMAVLMSSYENIIQKIEEITLTTVSYFEMKGIYLLFDTNCEEAYGYIDVEKIQCVLLCILSNALKFSPENETVSVIVTQKDDAIKISFSNKSLPIESSILEIINDLVDKSNKITNLSDGTGLGLSLAKNILSLHGGYLRVEYNQPFFIAHVYLPINKKSTVDEKCGKFLNSIDQSMIYMEFSDVFQSK